MGLQHNIHTHTHTHSSDFYTGSTRHTSQPSYSRLGVLMVSQQLSGVGCSDTLWAVHTFATVALGVPRVCEECVVEH